MKKLFATLITCIFLLNVNAQTKSAQKDCDDYYSIFKSRGAKEVPDGNHEIIACIRKEGGCTCIQGKISVKGGKVVNDLMLLREDGTYSKFEFKASAKYAKSEGSFHNFIENGMSPTFRSENDDQVTIYFIKFLNPKAAGFKVAPAAGDL